MRRLDLRGLITATLVSVASLLACAGGAAADSTSVWSSASALALPAGASSTAAATSLPSVSCGSATQCVAVGAYSSAKTTAPMVLGATDGAWTGASAIALPKGASSGLLASVSCTGAATCTAVGTAKDASAASHPLLASELSGVWSNASEVPGIAQGSLSGVSCVAARNCTAVGSQNSQPMVMSGSKGAFSQTHAPALPAGGKRGGLTSVDCTPAGNCTAVGHYVDASGQTQAMVASESNGAWAQASEIGLPSDAGPAPAATLKAVTCPTTGQCDAVGSYVNTAGHTVAMIVAEHNAWGQAVALTLPIGATASTLDSISCTSRTACTATGAVVENTVAPLAASTDAAGAWLPGVLVATPAGAAPRSSLSAASLAVDCIAADQCEAAGTYPDAAGVGAMAVDSHPSLVLTGHALPVGVVGSGYSAAIAASGGTGGDVWTVSAGSLPDGLSLDPSTGVISGTPRIAQTTSFSVSVSDDASPPDQAGATFSLSIDPAKRTTTSKKPPGRGKQKRARKRRGAQVESVTVIRGSSVRVTLACLGQRRCDGRVAIFAVEHLRRGRLIAINATAYKLRGTRTRTIWIGSAAYALRGGRRQTRTIRLDSTGARLLETRHRFHAGLALRPAASKRATVVRTVKLHEPSAGRRP